MISIQKCDYSHISLLFNIAIKSYIEAYEYLWDDNGTAYMNKFYSMQLFKKEILSNEITYFLVYDDRVAVGYLKINKNALAPYNQKDCLEIEKLYFLKQFTGKGIGKGAISLIEKLAEGQYRYFIWLKVMESSRATSFYESNGFKQVQKTYLDHPHMKAEYRSILTFMKKIKPLPF